MGVWERESLGETGERRLTVRAATHEDVPELVALMREFYAESGYELDVSEAAGSFRTLIEQPALGGVWLADIEGRGAGYVVLSVRYAMEFGALSAYIDDLFVKPAFRRRGVATALLDALFAACTARGCASIHVEVGAANRPALALYSRFGLVPPKDDRVMLSGPLPRRGGET